jgi:hypothetical protein
MITISEEQLSKLIRIEHHLDNQLGYLRSGIRVGETIENLGKTYSEYSSLVFDLCKQDNELPFKNFSEEKPKTMGYYLVLTTDDVYTIFLWKENKWWFDETQTNQGILFGMKDEYVVKWLLIRKYTSIKEFQNEDSVCKSDNVTTGVTLLNQTQYDELKRKNMLPSNAVLSEKPSI